MSRHFEKLTQQEFFDKIKPSITKLLKEDRWFDPKDLPTTGSEFIKYLDSWAMDMYDKLIDSDLSKILFNNENLDTDSSYNGIKSKIFGLQTLPNGMPFVGVSAGGDWEWPICFILYWDGSKFRGYIPEKGNHFNKYTKTAYGSEDDGKSVTEAQIEKAKLEIIEVTGLGLVDLQGLDEDDLWEN